MYVLVRVAELFKRLESLDPRASRERCRKRTQKQLSEAYATVCAHAELTSSAEIWLESIRVCRQCLFSLRSRVVSRLVAAKRSWNESSDECSPQQLRRGQNYGGNAFAVSWGFWYQSPVHAGPDRAKSCRQ